MSIIPLGSIEFGQIFAMAGLLCGFMFSMSIVWNS